MEDSRTVSELLNEAETLAAAVATLAREFPTLTIDSLLALETAEVVELGWEPSAAHRDCSYLLTLLAMLQPISREHGDLPLTDALRILVDSGHDQSAEIAGVLAELAETGHA